MGQAPIPTLMSDPFSSWAHLVAAQDGQGSRSVLELLASPPNLFSQQAVQSPAGYPGCPPLNSSPSFSSMSDQLMLANHGSQTEHSTCSFHTRGPQHQSREPSFPTDAAQTRHNSRGQRSHFWQAPALSNTKVSHIAAMVSPPWPVATHITSPAKGALHSFSNVPPLHQTQSTRAPLYPL